LIKFDCAGLIAKKVCKDCGKQVSQKAIRCKSCAAKFIIKFQPHKLKESPTYKTLHKWIRRHLPKPNKCPDCGEHKRLDVHNTNREYKRDLSDWQYKCRRCHMLNDNRLTNFNYNRNKAIQEGFVLRDKHGRYIKEIRLPEID